MLGALLLFLLLPAPDEGRFADHFVDKALRVDLHHFGTAGQEFICLDELVEEPHFAGPLSPLVEGANLGSHRFQVLDGKTETLLYERGFCTLFTEWRTTAQARSGAFNVFEHTLILPYPKRDMVLVVSSRKRDGTFHPLLRHEIVLRPENIRTDSACADLKAVKLMYKGDPHGKVDIVILGDGYGPKEMKTYLRDAKAAMDGLLSESPFKENHRKFNFWAVESPSPESGVDEPLKGIYRSTRLGTTFNTFDIARYSMTTHIKALHDVAARVPYDYILIIFNSTRYGGGGIYNHYAMVTGSKPLAGVIAHEMGHCMAGLGDEYFTSSVSYVEFYPEGVEPWEPNITALVGESAPKWAHLIKKGTPIPTPAKARYSGIVGCFEGAGYKPKGLYRPCRDCIMKSCRNGYCPVCSAALEAVIRFHTK